MRTSLPGKAKRAPVYCLCFFFLFICALSADEFDLDELMYPTLISATYRRGKILVDFEPVAAEGVVYRIHRSNQQMSSYAELSKGECITEISSCSLPFQDEPASDGKYWYAVTVKMESGERSKIVPYQSATVGPVDFSPFPLPVEALDIEPESDRCVQIRFHPFRPDYTYILYAQNEEFADTSGLKPVKDMKGNSTFIFRIEHGRPYFFLVTTMNRLGVENTDIISGKNTNKSAFVLAKETPKPIPKGPPLQQRIDQTLRYSFYKGNYSESLGVFQSLLQEELAAAERLTVHYYIGQCFFYLGEYEKAIKHFILSKESDMYRSSAAIWIERSINQIE
jgi:hypothetical protein